MWLGLLESKLIFDLKQQFDNTTTTQAFDMLQTPQNKSIFSQGEIKCVIWA